MLNARSVVAFAAATCAGQIACACEPPLSGDDVRRSAGKDYVVAWRASPSPLKLSEFFALDVAICAEAGAAPVDLRVDAVMPEHRHGMNYRPTIKTLGNGTFRADGLMLHMPGLWEFSFDVRGDGKRELLKDRVTLR